jgi:hypothetical protein
VLGKPLGVGTARCRLDSVSIRLELQNRVSDGSFRLVAEENASRRVVIQSANGLECTATGVCDYRDAACLRLDRRDAEVLFRGKEKRARSAEERSGLVALDAPDELYVRPCRGADFLNIGPAAGDN